MFCPNCSQNLPDGARFCPACGQKIEEGVPAPASQPVSQPVAQPVRQPVAAPAQPQQPAAAPQVPVAPAQPRPQQPAQPAVQPQMPAQQPAQPAAQPQASGFYSADSSVPPAVPVSPAPAPAPTDGGKPKKKGGKLVGILVAIVAFVIASQVGQCTAESFLDDADDSSVEMSESVSSDIESPDLDEVLEPPTSDIDFDDTYAFGGLSIPVNSSWEPDSTTDEAGDTVCYFLPFYNNEICLQQIDTGVVLTNDEVPDYNMIFIEGLEESDLQLQNGTCYAEDESGKNVLVWNGSYMLDGEEYAVTGKTYFIGTDMVVASYSYPLSEADDGYSRAVSFLERVKVA